MVDTPVMLQRLSHPSIADNGGQGVNKVLEKTGRVTDNSASTPSEILSDSNIDSSPNEDEYIMRPASYSVRPSSNNTVLSHSTPGESIENVERLKQKEDIIVEEKVINAANGMDEKYSFPEEEEYFPWARVGSFSESGKGVPIAASTRMVRAYLTEHIYNDWYNNTSAVVGTCFFSWLIAYLGFCWLSLPAVFFCTASVYRAESRRFKRNIRDDLKRTAVAETLESKYETTVWLNTFLAKFWVIYMPVLSEQVKSAVNPQLAGTAPGYGIDALSLEEFTLGSKAPSIQSIKSYPKKGDNVVQMDWKFSFTPSDVSDMTANEAKNKVNPKISLGVTLGKSFVSKTLPVLVEDINVAGNVRVTMTFSSSFPNIKTVSISLLEPPLIDFALKPVGGDTLGIDIMSFLPGLKTVVKSLIDSNARPMLYAPNHLDFDVEDIMKAQSQDVIGVVAVTLHSAQGLKFMGSANPFISISSENTIDGVDPVVKSQVKYNSKAPKWSETKYFLVSSLQQKLFLKCLHSHEFRKDSLIGECEYDLSELYQNPSQHGLELELESNRKSRGVLKFDLDWYPVAGKEEENKEGDSSTSASDDVSGESEEDEKSVSDVGVFKFVLHKVKYLSTATSFTGSLSPSAELYIDGKKCKSYRTLRRMNEPSWEETLEILVPSKVESEFALKVYDERISGKELICEYTAPVGDVASASQNGDEFLKGSPQGEIYFGAEWKPVAIPENVIASKQAMRDPLGAVRLHIRDASILESLEGVGDIDAYFVVSRDRTVIRKSNYFSKTSTPTFNNVIYIPIVSERQTVFIDLYDFQKIGKDRYIGGCHFKMDSLIERDPTSGKILPVGSDNKVLQWKLCDKSKKLTSNIIRSSVTFIPTIPVYGPHEMEKVQELERKISEKQKEFEATQAKLRKEMEQHPEDYEVVEIDVEDKDSLQLRQKEKMALDELVAVNSGVISLRVSKGKLAKVNGYLQVLCDEFAYPVSISSKAEDGLLSAERAEYFVRDLQNSLTTFRVVARPIVKGHGDIISEETFNTLELLKKSYAQPTTINVRGSTIDIQMMYSPSTVKLPPSETVIDTGLLDLEINSAENIPAHDRNGLSDPYVVVKVDGESLFTTDVMKKTLSPTWNAKTRVPIPSRARSSLILELYDWDRSGSNTLLSKASFPLPSLGVDTSQIFSLDLEPQGRIKVRTRFEPQYIRPAVNVSEGSFVAMPLKAVGTVANFGIGMAGAGVGAAAGAAANVADFGIGGIQKGGRLLKGIGGLATKSASKSDEPAKKLGPHPFDASPNAVPNNSYATVNKQRGSISTSQDPSSDLNSIAGPPGVITQGFSHTRSSSLVRNIAPNSIHPCTLTIVAAENLGKSVQIRVSLAKGGRMKHIYRTEKQKADENGSCLFNETCEFKAPPEANLIFGAIAHHTFSKDTNLGLTQVNLGDPQLQQEGQILIKLGRGHIIFKIDYGDAPNPPVPSIPNVLDQQVQG